MGLEFEAVRAAVGEELEDLRLLAALQADDFVIAVFLQLQAEGGGGGEQGG